MPRSRTPGQGSTSRDLEPHERVHYREQMLSLVLPWWLAYLLIPRFRLLAELGRGAQAVVWRAHDERLDREVALKLLVSWKRDGQEERRVELAHPRHYSVKTTPAFAAVKAELEGMVDVLGEAESVEEAVRAAEGKPAVAPGGEPATVKPGEAPKAVVPPKTPATPPKASTPPPKPGT